MIDASREGGAVILKGAYIRSGIHPMQDSKSGSTGPYTNEIIALDRYYFSVLGNDLFKKNGRVFIFRNYFRLSRWYEWIGMEKTGLQKNEFLKLAAEQVGFSVLSMRIGFFYEIIFGFPYRLKNRFIAAKGKFLVFRK